MTFKDYFSRQSQDYARFRPHYPQELLAFLSGLVSEHDIAWDCATGNGQVATALTKYFARVYASDGSQAQINNAQKHDKVEYLVSIAEYTPFSEQSINLITVAQAFHWFDAERFFQEVKRVLKPQGILALWCYDYFHLPHATQSLQDHLHNFYEEIDSFWPPERILVKEGYVAIPFPFTDVETPPFSMSVVWTAEQVIGYYSTWSAVQRYFDRHGEEKISYLFEQIAANWGQTQLINWSLSLRVGSAIS
jgi:ubiquinone/menaquinone biosynthesis C-methylase UbiE